MLILQSSAAVHIVFLMVDSGDHLTGKTGLTPTVTISKNAGAFASPSGAVSEIANGWYKLAGHASDTGTMGVLALHATSAGADTTDMIVGEVVAFNPQDAAGLGLSRIDAAITTRASQTSVDTVDDFLDTEIAAIKAKTDNLPSDPADASDIAAAFSTVNTNLSTVAGYIDTEVAAIKAKTDNLPSDPADASDIAAAFATVNSNIAGVQSDTDNIQTRLPAALVGGRMDASVEAMAEDVVTAAAIATDAIGSNELAASAITEIQTGLSTLDAAGVRAAVGLATANLDTQLDALPTNAELTTALGTADDAVLAAIAALNNLSPAGVRTAIGLATANLDTQLDALPTNAELATALAGADDAVLAAIAALNNLSSAQAAAAVWAAASRTLTAFGFTVATSSDTKVTELHKIQGLDATAPMTVTTTTRVAGSVHLDLTGDGETTKTVTRA